MQICRSRSVAATTGGRAASAARADGRDQAPGEWFRDARFARSSTTGFARPNRWFARSSTTGVRALLNGSFPPPAGGNAALRDRPNRWSLKGRVVGPLAPATRARARPRLRCDSVGSPQLWRAVRHRHGDRGGLFLCVDVVAPADPSTGSSGPARTPGANVREQESCYFGVWFAIACIWLATAALFYRWRTVNFIVPMVPAALVATNLLTLKGRRRLRQRMRGQGQRPHPPSPGRATD